MEVLEASREHREEEARRTGGCWRVANIQELGVSSASTATVRSCRHLCGHGPEGFGFSVGERQGSLHT